MSIPGSANALLLASTAAAPASNYQIERSLRFNSSDSAYLSRTPTAGNRTTWTWAAWVKRSGLGANNYLFEAGASDTALARFIIRFSSDNTLLVSRGQNTDRITSQVFRDVSAWCHLVVAIDTTQGIANDRIKIYFNGTQITTFSSTSNPGPSDNLGVNAAAIHAIGRSNIDSGDYFNGYLADIYFIDGQALDHSSFTEVSATTGQLIPKAYTGTFTGNSFWLKFSDNSSTTSGSNVGIGKDFSGLGNYWNSTNLSVTAGAGNDSLVDTPTSYGTDTYVGGEVRGNYCTLNPLDSSATLTNGNLDAEGPTNAWHIARGTIAFPSNGKWYWEMTRTGTAAASVALSVATASAANSVADFTTGTGYYGVVNNTGSTINKVDNGSATTISTAEAWAQNDVLMCAYDGATGKVWFGRNGTWYPPTSGGTAGDPAAGTNATLTASGTVFPAIHSYGTSADLSVNFGQRPFAYTAPSGFKALCDTNLTSTTITTSGSYTGNGTADGPFVYLNGVPTAMTIGGNAVTFGTHADKLSNGFKIRTSSTTYNQNASSYSYSITSTGAAFKNARAQPNP